MTYADVNRELNEPLNVVVSMDDARIEMFCKLFPETTGNAARHLCEMLARAEQRGRNAKAEDLGQEIEARVAAADQAGERRVMDKYADYLRNLSWYRDQLRSAAREMTKLEAEGKEP